jgi:SecD/SecF fusion protein
MTRYYFSHWVQNPEHKSLSMARFFTRPNINFMKWTKTAVVASIAVIIVGAGCLLVSRHTMFGMDFTGGYALTVSIDEKENEAYRTAALKALIEEGAPSTDVQVRELNRPNVLRIQLGTGMEQPGRPFYGLPMQSSGEGVYSYQSNPRIVWVVTALASHGLQVKASDLSNLEKNWTEMSGQLSDTMRNSALWGLTLALLCILIYLSFRFEFKYAISDVLITLGVIGMLHVLGVSIQIDLQVIAAIMTIIGYSLNDTIIIFDRIREDVRLMRKVSFGEIVNHALNATLSRTMMTSGTTLLVLLALVLLGGPAIFSFALVMTLGVIIGTLSSLFVAAPLLLFFHNRELERQSKELTYKKV